MYREVPGDPMKVVGSTMIKDHGYLQRLEPGYRYQFVDDPSGRLLSDFVLLGTWTGIMEFLEKHQEQLIENNCSIPVSGIYMAVRPYRPIEKRYEAWRDPSTGYVLQWLVDLLSSFIPTHSLIAELPVADLAEAVKNVRQGQKPLLEDNENQKTVHSPWNVFAIVFSVLNTDNGFHFIGKRSVDFGTVRRILKSAS